MKALKLVLFWVWQWTWGFISSFLGLFVFLFCLIFSKQKQVTTYKNCIVLHNSVMRGCGLSMGVFIFTSWDCKYDTVMLKHEYGHALQSLLLGPLNLFVIVIPSSIWFWCFDEWRRKKGVSYYWLYCEAWANKWGGVKR